MNPETGEIDSTFMQSCELACYFNDCAGTGTNLIRSEYDPANWDMESNTTTIEGTQNFENKDLQDSVDNTGNTIDTDFLFDIVENTKATVDNQQDISDQLTDINNNITTQGNRITGAIGGIGNRPINVIGGGGTSEPYEVDIEGTEGDFEDEIDTNIALDYEQNPDDFALSESDAGDAPDYDGTIGNAIESNPVSTLTAGSGVTVTAGDCYFSENITVMGRSWDVEFSFCEYEGYLNALGAFLLVIAGLTYIWVIVK